jgi:hypothetical protein
MDSECDRSNMLAIERDGVNCHAQAAFRKDASE